MKTKKSNKANLENKRGILFLTGLVTALGFVLLAFAWETTPNPVQFIPNSGVTYIEDDYFPPIVEKVKEPPKRMIEIQTIEIVDNAQKVPDDFEISGSEINEDPIDFNIPNLKLPEEKADNNDGTLFFAEQMPEFPGGKAAFMKYLAKSVKYPLIALENGIYGKVYVSFVINENGEIEDANIIRGVDHSLDNEALRIVRSLPRWKPGKQGGKTVKVRYSVPIIFELR